MKRMLWCVHTFLLLPLFPWKPPSMRNVEQHPDWLSAHWAAAQSVLSLLHGFINAPYLHRVHVVPVK